MSDSLIEKLNQAFCILPGVGNKAASRFVYHLLEKDKAGGLLLAEALEQTLTQIKQCRLCRSFSQADICHLCSNNKRDKSLLCIVGTSSDIVIIEKSGAYKGLYFVLNGYLSPLDGIDAEQLQLNQLEQRLQLSAINEVILAINATMEGQITAHYLSCLIEKYPNINLSQIAHGIPLGGEIEYADANTIFHAIAGRKPIGE